MYNDSVKYQLYHQIDELPLIRRFWVCDERSEGVEKRLQDYPYELAKSGAEKLGL